MNVHPLKDVITNLLFPSFSVGAKVYDRAAAAGICFGRCYWHCIICVGGSNFNNIKKGPSFPKTEG